MRPLFVGIAVAIATCAIPTVTTAQATDPKTPATEKKPTVTLKLEPYEVKVAGTSISMPLVPIQVGQPGYPATFRMGSPESDENRKPDEAAPFGVTMAPFWIGKFEVTWDEFNEFREQYSKLLEQRVSKRDDSEAAWADAVSIPTPLWEQDSRPILMGMGEKGGYPVADISRYAARQFTKWLS
ncbi:MAG: SUMF1/EgtB/PvdO family nonheme iron enzyme, partial [Planctomycetota bacterium]